MPENKIKEVFPQKRVVLRGVLLLLASASLYCYLQGRLVWSGIFFLLVGILSPFSGLPYTILFILIGLTPILFAYRKMHLLIVVTLAMTVIALLDAVALTKLMISKKHCMTSKSEFLICLRENEITYKLWNRLKRKYKQKS